MILLAIVLIVSSLGAAAVGLGVVSMPDNRVHKRAMALAAAGFTPKKSRRLIPQNQLDRGWLAQLTPPSFTARIERNLVLAGRPDGWSLDKAILYKPIGFAFGVFFFLVMLSKGEPMLVLFGLAMIVLGYFFPDLLIKNMAIKRQEQIQKELPDLLDQVVISIEAGVGFEAALARAGERNTGPLADEVLRLVQDIGLGLSRREAYSALADRTTVEDLQGFCRSVVQAQEYGVSISSVVRSQAKELRLKRRMRAEAAAQKVPVKILIPLMICVLPVLFVIVLGPAIVSAYANN